MTDGPVRVMPREPLVAERIGDRLLLSGFRDGWDDVAIWADPAHFVPAAAYERLIAAVGWMNEMHERRLWKIGMEFPPECACRLCAAYRACFGSDD